VFKKNFADELAVIKPPTPRRRLSVVVTKHDGPETTTTEQIGATERPAFIPPINIELAPTPIPASVQISGTMSRSSVSSLRPSEDYPRTSTDTGDRESEKPQTIRSQDRRSFTSRITGASVRSIRKTLSFRGRKIGEIP
jgi:hypothetical protein